MNKLKQFKKLPLLLALVGVLALPMVVRTYANEDTPVEELPVVTEEPIIEEPETPAPVVEEPLVVKETPEEPEPEVEDPETTVDEDGVTLGEAQIIATTEHSESTIKKVKLGVFEGNAIYKFYFEDGWKVSVRAIDGMVVEVNDPSLNKHSCKNELMENPEFQAWLEERKEQREEGEENMEISGASEYWKHNGWNKHWRSHDGRHDHE